MKKLLALIVCFLFMSLPAQAAGPAGQQNTPQYNAGNGIFGGFTATVINGVSGWFTPFFQAANMLYIATNGMQVDPRFFGAACNTQYFNGRQGGGYYGANPHFITTTNGSPVISIQNYTPKNCTAQPGNDCDIGKVVSIWSNSDVGPTWLAGISTSPNTVVSVSGSNLTLATALQATNTPGGSGGFQSTGTVMGGYNGRDDTLQYESAIWFSAVYHGGKVVVPPNCLIHGLTPAGGGLVGPVWLAGNNGATAYGSPAQPLTMATPLYVSSNNYAEDPLFGIDLTNSQGFKISNVSFIGTFFPFLAFFPGITTAAIGSSGTLDFSPHGGTIEQDYFALFPVGFGVPLGLNVPITLNGQVAAGTNQLLVNSVSSTTYATNYGAGSNPPAPDWLIPGQTLNGAGIPAGTTVVSTISYLGGSTTGLYALNRTITGGVLAETMTTTSPAIALSGEGVNNQFYNVGIGLNGDLSDYRDYNSTFTAAPIYIGPVSSGSGNAANSFYGERIEDLNNSTPNAMGAITIEGQGTDQFNGIFCQFNEAPCFLTRGSWNDITVTGGIIQGNGVGATPKAQIILGGTGTRFNTVGTTYEFHNFAFGGDANYLAATLTGAAVTQLSIESGDAQVGFTIAPFDFSRASVATYKLDVPGLPKFDTTIGYTAAATNCTINTATGGAFSGSVLAGVTTAACSVTLTLPKSIAGQPWDCAMHDTTSGGTAWAISATTSTSCTGLGATNTGDNIQFNAR